MTGLALAEKWSCAICGERASHKYTPPLFRWPLLLCNGCNPTHAPTMSALLSLRVSPPSGEHA